MTRIVVILKNHFLGFGLMEEILHQLRMVVYSIIYSQGFINSWWLAGYLPSTGDDVISCRLLYHAEKDRKK